MLIGRCIGKYRVLRTLGEGGYGTVYEGVNEQIGKRVAIKTLHPELSGNREMCQRFLNEARAVNIIQHPGIVNVFEFGQLDDGTTFIIMEYLEGTTLRARLKEGPALSIADALHLGAQVAGPVAAAHDKGIVHRDLKPDNVMLLPGSGPQPAPPQVKLLDFGIAKLAEQQRGGAEYKTRTGTPIGTPAYMSPEQCRGEREVDGKSDVYALGVILYQLLCGKRPFESKGEGALMAMHIYETPRPVEEHNPAISAQVAALVKAMLQKEPEVRPGMRAVETELLRLQSGAPGLGMGPSSRPARSLPTPQLLAGSGPSVRGIVAAGCALLLLAAGLWWRLPPRRVPRAPAMAAVRAPALPPPAAAAPPPAPPPEHATVTVESKTASSKKHSRKSGAHGGKAHAAAPAVAPAPATPAAAAPAPEPVPQAVPEPASPPPARKQPSHEDPYKPFL